MTTTTDDAISRRTGLAFGVVAAAAAGLALASGARAADANGMVKVTVLYGAPTDPAAFEAYYLQKHMPLVYAAPGIAKIELAKPMPGPDGKPPAYYRITELWFDNAQALQAVTARPDWAKIVADVPNFASGGATILVSPIEPKM